ncbi:hypothetical protein PENTCL1PPCAC_22275, partial [Pristionchus entomophagus]
MGTHEYDVEWMLMELERDINPPIGFASIRVSHRLLNEGTREDKGRCIVNFISYEGLRAKPHLFSGPAVLLHRETVFFVTGAQKIAVESIFNDTYPDLVAMDVNIECARYLPEHSVLESEHQQKNITSTSTTG